ncbi:hypothetical protein [Marinihelvus fidelis]|nr:hypothetical protein [Marinihelvus fidelis]
MHPYTMLKTMLVELGAELTSEDLRPDVFGSAVATYNNHSHPIRIVWDGKDGWGFVQQYRSGNWTNATDFLTEGDLEGVPQNHAKIEQFRQAVATLLR